MRKVMIRETAPKLLLPACGEKVPNRADEGPARQIFRAQKGRSRYSGIR
jgi:hypothetical protein